MSSRLEQFIRDHREAFDAEEPPKRVWDQIHRQGEPGQQELQPVIWLNPRQWSVAAAVSLLIAAGIWYFTRPSSARMQPGIATASPASGGQHADHAAQPDRSVQSDHAVQPADNAGSPAPGSTGSASPETASPETASPAPGNPIKRDPSGIAAAALTPQTDESAAAADYREEMVYYTGLVKVKHRELERIEKDEPLLYKQFAGDINKLDSVYHVLEDQLSQNPNHVQLLEAMLQDLQLQMRLLNHQLDIIKKINHLKKTAYEKAYKSA